MQGRKCCSATNKRIAALKRLEFYFKICSILLASIQANAREIMLCCIHNSDG